MGKHLTIILKEMCRLVGADFKEIAFKDDSWYHEYSWSQEDEDDFKEWVADYIFINKEARKELTTIKTADKKKCKEFASQFAFNYGWKIKPDNEVA
jgi:hypothetical protein